MLKKKLTAAAYAELDAALKALYKKAEGSDNYLLEIDASEDDGAELKKAKDREKKRADKAEADLAAAQTRLDELEAAADAAKDGALDKAGVDALKTRHQKELDKVKAEVVSRDAAITKVLVEDAALKLASDISTVPELLAGEIQKRLKLVYEDGKPVVRVLDDAGEVTEKKFEDLSAEVVANPKFAPIIQASKASGGGAAGGSKGGGAPKKKLSEMSGVEEAAFANSNPSEYQQMVAAGA